MISTTTITNNQEYADMDIEEEEMINIETLEFLGISAGTVKKLKDIGIHTFQQFRTTPKKKVLAINRLGNAMYNKLVASVYDGTNHQKFRILRDDRNVFQPYGIRCYEHGKRGYRSYSTREKAEVAQKHMLQHGSWPPTEPKPKATASSVVSLSVIWLV